MKISMYKARKNTKLEKRAIKLYKTGFSVRDVGRIIEKSHMWVWRKVRKLSTPLRK